MPECWHWFGVPDRGVECFHWLPYLNETELGPMGHLKLTLDLETGAIIDETPTSVDLRDVAVEADREVLR